MRVLMVGAGAVGGYFGGRLAEAGRDVTFLVRPHRRDRLAATGLVIRSPLGDWSGPVRAIAADQIVQPYDLIIVSCKAYDLPGAIHSFAPAVGPDSMVLPLLNGMRHMDILAARFGQRRVLGGLCAIVATLSPDGAVLHLNDMHSLTFGDPTGDGGPRLDAIARLMDGARFASRASAAITLEMWEKWVFLATLAGMTCLMRASVGDIAAAGGSPTMLAMLAEAHAVAVAAGHANRPEVLEKTRAMLTTPGSTITASMLRDVEKGGPTEADHVIGDLIDRGGKAGLALPLLTLAALHLAAGAARRARGG